MIDYSKYKAHPTRYKDRQYRSRLEARWAAWFDLMEWPVEYEPFDLNGWVPDFLIKGATPILVEVKPITEFHLEVAVKMSCAAPLGHDLLLLGSAWNGESDFHGWPAIGWLGEAGESEEKGFDGEHHWGAAVITKSRHSSGCGLFHDWMGFDDRLSGEYSGDHHLRHPGESPATRWVAAANLTQWRASA